MSILGALAAVAFMLVFEQQRRARDRRQVLFEHRWWMFCRQWRIVGHVAWQEQMRGWRRV